MNMIEERPNGDYYTGPPEPAKAYFLATYGEENVRTTYRDGAVSVGEFSYAYGAEDDDPNQWGCSESGDLEEAWRYLLGADFGPLDEGYDETSLRNALRPYGLEG